MQQSRRVRDPNPRIRKSLFTSHITSQKSNRNERHTLPYHPFPLARRKLLRCYSNGKDSTTQLPFVDRCHPKQIRNSKFPYHRRKGNTFEQCVTFRRNFDKKLQAAELIFLNKGALNVQEQAFLNPNNDRGKGQVMTVSASE